MHEYILHAEHNHSFHDMICTEKPEFYFDWKVTCLFYVAFHYLKALAAKRGKEIGDYHVEINRNIRSGKHNPSMPIQSTAFENYMTLFHYSQTARYEGIDDLATFTELRKLDYNHALKCFNDFKKFLRTNGIIVEEEN